MIRKDKTDSGVSPVIGIILMVAVTVALVALAANIVFDLGDDVGETADVTVDLEVTEGDESDWEASVEVLRNENAEQFTLDHPGGEEEDEEVEPGEVTTLSAEGDWEEGDEIIVTATIEDGGQEIVDSQEVGE